jgi:hypothetical protein
MLTVLQVAAGRLENRIMENRIIKLRVYMTNYGMYLTLVSNKVMVCMTNSYGTNLTIVSHKVRVFIKQ